MAVRTWASFSRRGRALVRRMGIRLGMGSAGSWGMGGVRRRKEEDGKKKTKKEGKKEKVEERKEEKRGEKIEKMENKRKIEE